MRLKSQRKGDHQENKHRREERKGTRGNPGHIQMVTGRESHDED